MPQNFGGEAVSSAQHLHTQEATALIEVQNDLRHAIGRLDEPDLPRRLPGRHRIDDADVRGIGLCVIGDLHRQPFVTVMMWPPYFIED